MTARSMHHPHSLHWQSFSIGREARAALKLQRPMVLWFTGLSGSGKSTIANILEQRLSLRGRHTFILDGDNLRHGLNRDLGFTVEHRCENIRRTAEVAMLMTEAGLIVLVCLISPFRSERQLARNLMRDGDFIEIFVDTPLGICAERDPKGLYRKAFSGEIANFTGVSSPYEAPEKPDIHLVTDGRSPFELASQVEQYLEERHLSPPYQLRQA